jgi:hypothetical protein
MKATSMTLTDIFNLDLWQVRRLALQMQIDAKTQELLAEGHPAEAVRDMIIALNEELTDRGA